MEDSYPSTGSGLASDSNPDLPSVESLKQAARVLQKRAQSLDAQALKRLRKVPELRPLDDEALLAALKRRHCLSVVARELGFHGWSHLMAVLDGREQTDFGKLLYPASASYWNIWSASYDEAQRIRQQHGGYLLPYGRQFVIVDQYFVQVLGLDPDDADWQLIERDWVRPVHLPARRRLYDKVIRHRLAN